jgi:hypothetical protein
MSDALAGFSFEHFESAFFASYILLDTLLWALQSRYAGWQNWNRVAMEVVIHQLLSLPPTGKLL